MLYHLKILEKMQRRTAVWILGAFKTSPSLSIKVITGLIPIKSYLQKLGGRLQLQAHSLSPNHLIQFLIELPYGSSMTWHPSSLNFLTRYQRSIIKSYLVNTDNRYNRIFPSFTPLYSKLSPGHRIIDIFSDCLVFNLHSKQNGDKSHI